MMKTKYPRIFRMVMVCLVLSACVTLPQSTTAPAATIPLPSSPTTELPPSPTPTITPTPVPNGSCVNVFYPLLPGSEWMYQTVSAEGQQRMTFIVTGIENDLANFQAIYEGSGVTIADTVRCREGAIENLPLIYISLLLSDYLDGVLNTYQESGITAPSYNTFTDNHWSYSWGVEKLVEQLLKVELPGLGTGYILRSNTVKIQSETTGIREAVTVLAGTFPQAILVLNEFRAPVTVGNSGAIFTVEYREWYEPYIGLLKIETDAASLDFSGSPIPFPLKKTLELVEYKTGAR